MARVALVSHDVPTIRGRSGGVGTFVAHFSQLLREQGHEVTIVLTRQETEPTVVDELWRNRYESRDIRLIELHNTPPSRLRWSDVWPVRLSEQVAPLLREFDVAYFQDWANVAFQAARAKRFSPSGWPVLVTVLHGPSAWIRAANQKYPRIPEDLHVEFIERYSARYSDRVAAPSRYILDWVRRDGWTFTREPDVLGLPYLPPPLADLSQTTPQFRQIVFFGRIEQRKGLSLLSAALRRVRQSLPGLDRIVLLGYEDQAGAAERFRRELGDLPALHISNLDTLGAVEYLRSHRDDSLVVIPSPVENFPYAVMEASLIRGLRGLFSNGGGVPEIFSSGETHQLFEPYPAALAAKLVEQWNTPPDSVPSYDYAAANQRWLVFHESLTKQRGAAVPVSALDASKVDVCVTYFNKAAQFPQLLEALANQTVHGFGVIAVDDGSTDPEAEAVFASLAAKYASRGWIFFRQRNMFVDAARNQTARRSQAEFLLFIDADDVPAPEMVERLLSAALMSGDDCLITGGLFLDGASVEAYYMPLGPNLATGLIDPIIFGPPTILIRRSVFEAIGGYRQVRGAAHEDWELQIRLLLRGYRTDVVPEFLLQFRRLEDGLARTSEDFPAKRRLIDAYEEELAKIGLHGIANTVQALYRRCRELDKAASAEVPVELRMRLHDRVLKMLSKKPQP